MADQTQDPSKNYERSHPGRESGGGKLDSPIGGATPQDTPDRSEDAAHNKQDGTRQVNAHDAINQRGGPAPEEQQSRPPRPKSP